MRTSVNILSYIPFMYSYFGFMLSASAWRRSAVVSQSAPSAVSGCTVSPVKGHYCPHSPVNWLITSLMRMEQPATMGALSDGQVTSEPKTRACLIWENGLRADKIPEHEAVSGKGGWVSNGWISASASDRCTVNLILHAGKDSSTVAVWE